MRVVDSLTESDRHVSVTQFDLDASLETCADHGFKAYEAFT
jgi:hypothetical protein